MSIRRKLDDSLSVAASIGHLVCPLLYPCSSIKCVTKDNGHRFTRDALTLLDNLDCEHPVGQYVNDVCRGFVEQYGTGGDQLLYFISSLTKAAHLLCDMGIPQHVTLDLLGTVVEGCIEHTGTLTVTVTGALDTTTDKKHPSAKPSSNKLLNELNNSEDNVYNCESNYEKGSFTTDLQNEERHEHTKNNSDNTTKCAYKVGDLKARLEEKSPETIEETIAAVKMNGTLEDDLSDTGSKLKHNKENLLILNNENLNCIQHTCITNTSNNKTHPDSSDDIKICTQGSAFTEADIDEHIVRHNKLTSDRGVDDDQFIDGIKIVQLKMNNAKDSAKDSELEEDISWFFQSGDNQVSMTEIENIEDKERHLASSKEVSYGSQEYMNSQKAQNEIYSDQTTDNDLTCASRKEHTEKKNESTEAINHIEVSESGELDIYEDIQNELTALKSNIEMDIKRIKQGQDKLEKLKNQMKNDCDAHYDSCCKGYDDEFDPCFDSSVSVKQTDNGKENFSYDSKSLDGEFKTVHLTFEKETDKYFNGVSVASQNHSLSKEIGSELNARKCDSHTYCQTTEAETWSNEQAVLKSVDNIVQPDYEFENEFEERKKLEQERVRCENISKEDSTSGMTSMSQPPIAMKLIVDNVKIKRGENGKSKQAPKTKLQEMNDLLKNLGIESNSSSYGPKSVQISSRHLTDIKDKNKHSTSNNEADSNANTKGASTTKSDKCRFEQVDDSKPQNIDVLLKYLCKDVKVSPVSAKSVRISSRHLSNTTTEDMAHYDICERNELTADKKSTELNYDVTKTNLKPEVLHVENCGDDDETVNNETQMKETSHNQGLPSSSDNLNINKLDELLKGLNGIQVVKSLEKTNAMFKSNVFGRSRHFGRVTDENVKEDNDIDASNTSIEAENAHRNESNIKNSNCIKTVTDFSHDEQKDIKGATNIESETYARRGEVDADIETVSNDTMLDKLDSAGRRRKILQLVADLNYGTDERTVKVITGAIVKQSTQTTISLQPQSVQTFTITGGQKAPVLVDGVVLKTSHAQAEATQMLDGRSCRLLIVNADITSTYKHKGYKPMKIIRVYTADTFPGHVTNQDQWSLDVTDVLKTLSVDLVLARGSISEQFKDVCGGLGVAAMEFVPYRQLSLISDATQITMVTYITMATEENVCGNVHISPWIPESGDETKNCVSRSCQHARVIKIPCNNPQTVVLQNHTQTLVDLEAEALLDCLHRTGSTLQSGLLLPGAGHTETACAAFCLDTAEKLLKESQVKHCHDESQFLVTAYEVLSSSFQDYSQIVQHHCTLVQNRSLDCVYDDYKSKVESWRTALDTVCTIVSSDFYIMTGIKEEQRFPSEIVIL